MTGAIPGKMFGRTKKVGRFGMNVEIISQDKEERGRKTMTDLGECRQLAEQKRWRLENSQTVTSPKPGTVAASLYTPEGPVALIFQNGKEVLGHWEEVYRKYA